MDFGAHLPLMDFGGNPYTLEHLVAYTETAARLGFKALASNDHMVFSVPWLDGPIALGAVIGHSGTMTLATTVSLPVIRGPLPLAKTLAAIDRLSQGGWSWPWVPAPHRRTLIDPPLLHNLSNPLLDQLIERVGTGPVDELIATAPFYDEKPMPSVG